MTFSVPIRGYLQPFEWVRPPGNTDMKVTQTAAQHKSSQYHVAGPPALDIGDGNPNDVDDIISCSAGTVTAANTYGSANLQIDYTDSVGQRWRFVYAHNRLPHPVVMGQKITMGQKIGAMGATNLTPILQHLHLQIGKWNGSMYVWQDPWALLSQNQGSLMPGFKIGSNIGTFKMNSDVPHALISPTDPKNVRYMQPVGAGPWDVAASLDLKTSDSSPKPVDIDGNSPPQGNRDQVYLVDAPGFGLAAYVLRQDGVFTAKGVDCASEVERAVAPLNAALAGQRDLVKNMKLKAAAFAADIGDD